MNTREGLPCRMQSNSSIQCLIISLILNYERANNRTASKFLEQSIHNLFDVVGKTAYVSGNCQNLKGYFSNYCQWSQCYKTSPLPVLLTEPQKHIHGDGVGNYVVAKPSKHCFNLECNLLNDRYMETATLAF